VIDTAGRTGLQIRRAWPEADADVIAPIAEHDELRQVVRQMLDKMASPERVRAAAESELGYAADLWSILHGTIAIGALAIPERLGGLGYGMRELTVILEECGAALLSEPIVSSSVLGAQALAAATDEAAVESLLAAVMAGERIVAVALDGPALVVRASDEGVVAEGRIPRLAHAGAADHVVAVGQGPQGRMLLLLDREACRVTPLTCIDDSRPQGQVRLEGAPATVLIAGEPADRVIERLRIVRDIATAAEHAGMTVRLLEMMVGYAEQRQQFGRQIGSFQAVKHRLADVLVDRERALSAVRYAAAVFDTDPAGAAVPAAIAASVCMDAVLRTVHETVQLHGGIGFTWEHPAHLYLRRALGDEGLYGSGRDHRERLAELLGF